MISGIDSNVGYTRLYGSHISWQTANRPLAKEINPRIVYERLFGKKVTLTRAKPRATKTCSTTCWMMPSECARDWVAMINLRWTSIWIQCARSNSGLNLRLDPKRTAGDRRSTQSIRRWLNPVQPANFREHIDLMLDLMVLAFQTDSTRVCSFMFDNDVSGRNFSFLDGVKGGITSCHTTKTMKPRSLNIRRLFNGMCRSSLAWLKRCEL